MAGSETHSHLEKYCFVKLIGGCLVTRHTLIVFKLQEDPEQAISVLGTCVGTGFEMFSDD